MVRRIFQFDDFRLDLGRRELRKSDGQAVVLPTLLFECIAWLIEHRDRAVGRDELISAIWGRTDVNDNLLVKLIARARVLLGDAADEQRTIRTVVRFGYQWMLPVRLIEEAANDEPSLPPAELQSGTPAGASAETAEALDAFPRAAPSRRGSRLIGVLLLALLLALVPLVWFQTRSMDHARDTRTATSSGEVRDVIAVMPFGGAAAADDSLAWLRLGLMDFVAARLREQGQPVVPSGEVVAVVRDEPLAIAAGKYRAATKVRYLLLPTVLRSDNGWVVHLDLQDRDGSSREVQASAPEVFDAARTAADQLLDRLGNRMRMKTDSLENIPVTELFQRAEAAKLANHPDDARHLLESAPMDLRNTPELQLRLAQIDFDTGRIEAARERYASLLSHSSAESDPVLRGSILSGLGAIDVRLAKAPSAEAYLTEAIALLEGANESAKVGRAYLWRGNAWGLQGQYEKTAADWSKARIAFGNAGDTLAQVRMDANEGALEANLNHLEAALALFQKAAQQFESFGVIEDLAAVRGNEIDSQLELLQPAAALDVATQAGERFDVLKNPLRAHWFKMERARAMLANGRLAEGQRLLNELARDIQPAETGLLSAVQAVQAESSLRKGDFEEAIALAQRSLAGLPALQGHDDFSPTRVRAWLVATRALRRLRRNADATAETQQFRTWAEGTGEPANLLQARLAEAEQAWSDERREAAIAIYDDLLRRAPREAGTPAYQVNLVLSYGNLLINVGYFDRAAEVVGQAARFAEHDFDCALLQARFYRSIGSRDAWRTALDKARSLAGERTIPEEVTKSP